MKVSDIIYLIFFIMPFSSLHAALVDAKQEVLTFSKQSECLLDKECLNGQVVKYINTKSVAQVLWAEITKFFNLKFEAKLGCLKYRPQQSQFICKKMCKKPDGTEYERRILRREVHADNHASYSRTDLAKNTILSGLVDIPDIVIKLYFYYQASCLFNGAEEEVVLQDLINIIDRSQYDLEDVTFVQDNDGKKAFPCKLALRSSLAPDYFETTYKVAESASAPAQPPSGRAADYAVSVGDASDHKAHVQPVWTPQAIHYEDPLPQSSCKGCLQCFWDCLVWCFCSCCKNCN